MVGPSRNYAFGKLGSMEPRMELGTKAASILAKLSDFLRWSGLLCEHRGITEHHRASSPPPRRIRRAYKPLCIIQVRSAHVLDPPSSALSSCLND
jgi:hypothetical protein